MISLHKIYSEDALELDAILFEPEKKTDTAIIHVHGKEGHFIQNHFISVMGQEYSKAGFAFLTFNNRGHDYMADMLQKSASGFEWVKKGTAYDKIEEFSHDINGVIAYLGDMGYTKFILQGHSLGPHKICYYLANTPKYQIEKIILLSSSDILYTIQTYIPDWETHSKQAEILIQNRESNRIMDVTLWNDAPVSAGAFWHYTQPQSNTWIFNYSHPEKEFIFFNTVTQPILSIFPENEFSIGVPPAKALDKQRERTASTAFTSHVIPGTVHNYMTKEEELVKKIITWLEMS